MYDENYAKNRFFSKYATLVDASLAKTNMVEYKKRLALAEKLTNKVDFNKNLLIVCKRDIPREIFLTGFSRLKSYRTFAYYNIYDILDFSMGTRDSNDNVTGEEVINSELDILQDVLCMTVNYYEATNKRCEELAVEAVMHRYTSRMNSVSHKEPKLTWVFSLGTIEELEARYPKVKKIFTETENPMFAFYDLTTGLQVNNTTITNKNRDNGNIDRF